MLRAFCLAAALATFAYGQNVPGANGVADAGAEQMLKELEAARSRAIKAGDMKTLERIYAEDFSGVASNGSVLTRAELLEVFKNTDPRLVFEVDALAVRTFGETAVVTGRLTGKTAAGELFGTSRFMHVYVMREKRWQMVAGQSTPLPR